MYKAKNDQDENSKRNIILVGERKSRIWIASAIIWNIASIALAIISFALSVLVIIIECYFPAQTAIVVIFAAITAIFTFAILVINFKQQAPRYRLAFTGLYSALIDYYNSPNDTSKKDAVAEAIKNGECIIDGTYDFFVIYKQ